MTNKLSIAGRILVAFASGALVAVFFLPAWRIDLFAPQYPEGLTMNIWINKLTGDVDIINGLNHYIGMNRISQTMFPEFKFLPFVVGFFMLFGLIIAVTGSRRLLLVYLLLTFIGGGLAMYDFYKWGYDYGHNLDPNAPIQVPGLSYQPPLLGHKRLLNFDAYSFPHIGGWIVICSAILAFGIWLVEKIRTRSSAGAKATTIVIATLLLTTTLGGCNTQPRAIEVGKENCSFCQMTIMDLRYSGEIVSKKGKIYVFDDALCMSKFLAKDSVSQKQTRTVLITDYHDNSQLLSPDKAWLVQSETIASPMGGHVVAFSQKKDAEYFLSTLTAGKIITWKEFKTAVSSTIKDHVQ